MKRLDEKFYTRDSTETAPLLLGKLLCRNINGKIIKAKITETECYFGESDTACHAHKGKTQRTKTLYKKGGIAYIYLCYGIHFLFNVVTGPENMPQAILIRAIENYDGPGKLTNYLHITKNLNEENLITSEKIWIEDSKKIFKYKSYPRIGINYATEEYRNKLWRFKLG